MARAPSTIKPMDMPKQGVSPGKATAAAGVSAAIALAVGIIAPWEGKRNDPYYDIVKVKTVCYGHTGPDIENRRYSNAECNDLLMKDIRKHAEPVFQCTPSLRDRPYEAAAAISLAFNVGAGAWCRSTADRMFDAGRWKDGCNAIGLYTRAGGKVVRGLVNRRRAEIAVCMKGSA